METASARMLELTPFSRVPVIKALTISESPPIGGVLTLGVLDILALLSLAYLASRIAKRFTAAAAATATRQKAQ